MNNNQKKNQITNQSIIDRDLAVVWHPCTQMKDHELYPPLPIASGSGVWLQDYDGNRYIDAISSWWVNLFGHCHPTIVAAVQSQLDTLAHVLLAGFTHEPVVTLSERLVAQAPTGLTRCFYADNGSSAVEVALKMSFHHWYNGDKPQKQKFVCLTNGYHGETLGALSVGDLGLYRDIYQPLLLQPITVKSPDCYFREPGESWFDYTTRMFAPMEELLASQNDEICAVIIEPLVQCAGHMRMYHAVYLQLLRQACDQYGVHLIADEVAVGFGRTGTFFACEQAKITPDFLCLSKGLTGGFMPLAVTLTTDKIYQSFYDDYATLKAFLHSHSYTGNPLGCAAALATLDLFEQSPVIQNNKQLSQAMLQHTAHFENHPNVAEVRQCGMILAIELVAEKKSKQPFPWQHRFGYQIYQYALKKGAILRPLGDVIYFMPPYVISESEIQTLSDIVWQGIEQIKI